MPTLDEMSDQELIKLRMDLAAEEHVEAPPALSDMSDDNLLNLYEKYKGVEEPEESSMWDQFMFGLKSEETDFHTMNRMTEQYPGTAQSFAGPPGAFNQLDAAQIALGDEKGLEVMSNQGDFASKMRMEQNKKKMEMLTEEYPDLVGQPDSLTTLGGRLAAYLVTPTTAIPFGGTVKSAIGVGATLGATDVASRQLAQEGDIDGPEVALAAAIGGTAAGVVQKLIHLFRARKASKKPVQETDLNEFIKEGDNRILAKQINERLGIIPDKKVKKRTKKSRKDVEAAFRELPEDRVLREMQAERVNAAFTEKELDRLVSREEDFIKVEKAEREKEDQIKEMWENYESPKPVRKFPDKEKTLDQSTKQLSEILDEPTSKVSNKFLNQKVEKTPTAIEQAYTKAQAKFADDLAKDVSDGLKIARNQAGGMSPQIMQHIATSSIGAAIGYATDPTPEGIMTGALIGGFAPWTVGKLYKAIKAGNPKTPNSIAERFAGGVRPWVAIKNMGPSGELLSKYMDLTNLQIDMRIGEVMHKVEDRLYKLSKEEQSNLIKVMQKVEKPINDNIRGLSTDLRNVFEDNLKEYARIGIITPEKAVRFINKGREEGYWPRIYNEAKLDTKEGREAWEKFFTEQEWTEKKLLKTLNRILHGDPERVKFYMKSMKKDGSTYFIPRHIARNILRERKNLRASNKSSHIEESRKINVKEEDLLNQFMVDNPYAVINDYLFDTMKRLEYAKTFGVKDERAHQLFQKIENELASTGMNLTDVKRSDKFAQNVYWTSVGSSMSETIAAHMKLSESWKTFYGKTDAIATWLLTHAQILNMAQALANGTVQIAGTKNPVSAFTSAIKGIYRSLGKEGQKFAQQTNASGEATLMEIMGEYGGHHKVINKQFNPSVEWLNDPTKFLKTTGFSYVEKLQRRFAVNQGKVYIEDLIDTKAKLLKRQAEGKWFSKRKLENVNKALDELYINPNHTNMEMIPEKELIRGSLKFSNIVNFRSNPLETPMAFQSPHARLFKKFKTFAYHQGAFVNSKVIRPAREYIYSGGKKGSLSPLVALFGIVVPTLGVPIDKFRDLIVMDDRDLTGIEMYLNGMFAVGGLGIFADLAKSAWYGEGKVPLALAGPSISQMDKFSQGVLQTGKKFVEDGPSLENTKPFGRGVVKSLVFPGKRELLEALKSKGKSSGRKRNKRRSR